MEKNNITLKMLHKFLSLFNIHILKEDYDNLSSVLEKNGFVFLYDDTLNSVGRVFVDNEDVIVQAMFKDYYISAIGRKIQNDTYCYEYSIKEAETRKKYVGKYETKKGIKLDDIMVKNSIALFIDGKLITRCTFDTLNNKFVIYNEETNNYVKYRNNEFYQRNKDTNIMIVNNFGEFIYEYNKGDNNIFGYSSILNDNKSYNYTDVELEFRRIIEEIDEEYFEFIKHEKELFNAFQYNLFELLACTGLKNFNRTQISAMLDIDFEKFSKNLKIKK